MTEYEIQIGQALKILLEAEIAENDDLPCKATVLRATAIKILAENGDYLLDIEQQKVLDEMLMCLPQ